MILFYTFTQYYCRIHFYCNKKLYFIKKKYIHGEDKNQAKLCFVSF
jgi:hypothetical protein